MVKCAFAQGSSTITGRIIPFIMSEEESFDINTPLDLEIARMLMQKKVKT